MNTNDLYYKKYLKYKSKYLELRGSGQIGGLKPCPSGFFGVLGQKIKSYRTLIKSHDCKYPQLEKEFEGFTYAKFRETNIRHHKDQLTIKELKERGFPLAFFIDRTNDPSPRNYPRNILIAPYIQEIKKWWWPADFKPDDFLQAEYTVAKLKEKDYSVELLINIGFTADKIREAGFTPDEIITGLTNTRKDLNELKALEFTIEELKKSRFDKSQFKKNQAKEFRKLYTLLQLKDAGFTVDDLRNTDEKLDTELQKFIHVYELKDLLLGFNYEELINRKYLIEDIFKNLPDKYLNVDAAKFFYDKKISIADLKSKGFTASIMIAAKIPIDKMLKPFDISELITAGLSATELKSAGFDVAALKSIGFDVVALTRVGFTASELRSAGFDIAALKSAGFDVAALKSIGFDVAALKSAGFTASDLKSAGFTVTDLKSAGFTASDLRSAGFSASDLRSAGFDVVPLKSAGFTASELISAGFDIRALRYAEFPESELQNLM
jgi:intracellular multiplication protein IcmE